MEKKNLIGSQTKEVAAVVRFDGRYEGFSGDTRSYTILSHTVVNGRDLFRCSFTGAITLLKVLKGEQI